MGRSRGSFARLSLPKTCPLALYTLLAANKQSTNQQMDLQNMLALNLAFSKIKLRPAHCPGQTRLCLPLLAWAPRKLVCQHVASRIGSWRRILLSSPLSTLFQKRSTKCSTRDLCDMSHGCRIWLLLLGGLRYLSAQQIRRGKLRAQLQPEQSQDRLQLRLLAVDWGPSHLDHSSSFLQLPIFLK